MASSCQGAGMRVLPETPGGVCNKADTRVARDPRIERYGTGTAVPRLLLARELNQMVWRDFVMPLTLRPLIRLPYLPVCRSHPFQASSALNQATRARQFVFAMLIYSKLP